MSKELKSIFNILSNRKHVREFDVNTRVSESLIDVILQKAWKVTPSKQNFMPYKVHVLGPQHQEYKDKLFIKMFENESRRDGVDAEQAWKEKYEGKFLPSYASVKNCSHLLIIQLRHLSFNDLNPYQKHLVTDRGHYYQQLNKDDLELGQDAIQFEAGLFANTVSTLCLEQGLDTSFFQCFPKELSKWSEFPFITATPLIVMPIGKGKVYRQDFDDIKEDLKPEYTKVVNFIN